MADGDRVALSEDVVRYARPSDVRNGVLGATAFVRPEKDKDGLSVCRLGVLAQKIAQDLIEIRRVMSAHMTLKANGRLAQISVKDIEDVGKQVSQALSVYEDHVLADGEKPANLAHALIKGLPFAGAENCSAEGLFASDLLALRVPAKNLHPAV